MARHSPTAYAEVDKDGVVYCVRIGCVEPPRVTKVTRWWIPAPDDLPGNLAALRWLWGKGKWRVGIAQLEPYEGGRGITVRE